MADKHWSAVAARPASHQPHEFDWGQDLMTTAEKLREVLQIPRHQGHLGRDGYFQERDIARIWQILHQNCGDHTLRVRAKDGDGWLEQTFSIKGGG